MSKRDYVDCGGCRQYTTVNVPLTGMQGWSMPFPGCKLEKEVVLGKQVECESFDAKVGTMETIRARYPRIEWELDEKGDPQHLIGTLKIGGEVYTAGTNLGYFGLDMGFVESTVDRLVSQATGHATKAIRCEALSREAPVPTP